MKYQGQVTAALVAAAAANPVIMKRQVPQEQSHLIFLQITKEFLDLNNPLGIVDPVFGLLGNAAAAEGVDADINLDCLKQFTADQAFTNAKAIGDVRGMAGALVYQALERNTGGVGVKSIICPEDAVNPEIAAFDQHQDPASDGATALNTAITLELAKQLALIGVDPLVALESGTFAPGDVNDATGAGNTCDTAGDLPGCIFTQRLLVLDASPDEVLAAVADVVPTFTGTGEISATNIDFVGLALATGGTFEGNGAAATTTAAATPPLAPPVFLPPPPVPLNKNKNKNNNAGAGAGAGAGASATAAPAPAATAAASQVCSVVTRTIVNCASAAPAASAPATPPRAPGAAINRSCDIQQNACANAANSGALAGGIGQPPTLRKRQGLDLGSCTDPTIQFGVGFDGRKEASFAPSNNADFNHGSAQRIGIISSFICQRLRDSCKAPADTVAACEAANTAALAATQDQAAADVFNQALSGAGAVVATPSQAAPATPASNLTVVTVTQCS
ncbi:unnamed protein product [Parascedosporium putredinis]|uniref:Uncharacterized protein n=1 Tax=Parascedosporium putredinis TaxID=1442378 RepID=A0A9P1GXX4_9PEZI|nr:unnamed protein product [Parascedosporium putredinis]CAI7989401.1 unnamed protein product [Parascedosporium putredinis]